MIEKGNLVNLKFHGKGVIRDINENGFKIDFLTGINKGQLVSFKEGKLTLIAPKKKPVKKIQKKKVLPNALRYGYGKNKLL